jgi:tetratricopeptide (TPR) repeat protein
MAAADVAALEAARTPAADVALARSRLLAAQAARPGADEGALLAQALAAASAAVAAEPAWADGHEQHARVLLSQANLARQAARPQESLALAKEALKDMVEALRVVRAEPGRRAQGASELRLLLLSIGARVQAWDWDGLTEDARALSRRAPGEIQMLRTTALALRTAGQFEEALGVYQTLSEVAPDAPTLADLAFCHQRLGVSALLDGRREKGLEDLDRALKAYDEAVVMAPRGAVVRAYRGETWLLRARWDPASPLRAERMAHAREDLEQASSLITGGQDESEVLFRRAGLRLLEADLEGARSDIARIVAGKPDLNPSFHGRYARILLALAARAAEDGDAAGTRARRDEALAQVAAAVARSGGEPGSALLLEALVRLLGSADPPSGADLEALEATLGRAAAADATAQGDLRGEAGLWASLARALSASDGGVRAAATRLWRERRAATARGLEPVSPGAYRALAALPAEGDAAARTALAERLARRVPP